VAASLLERAKSLGTGLRLPRFRPKDLRKTPRELSEKLADLMLRGKILGLYALTGRKVGSAAREFALFVPDTPTEAGIALEGSDPLTGLPVTGLIRTLLSCAEGAVPDLRGLELMDVLPSWEALPKSAKGRGESEADARSGRTPDASRDGIADSVEKFAPGSVAAKAIREGSTLEGEYRNATVLCAGIASFLETVRGAEPVRAAEQLNRLLSSFFREIEASDGVVDACVGGCLYAFWGAPAATGRDAASAADAALALRQILRALNKARVAAGRPAVRMALGLDSSPVLAGRIGSARCRSYTVAGEATRRAFLIGP
jgi:class 3 adenylate cyclase